jgi:hypothetical protein
MSGKINRPLSTFVEISQGTIDALVSQIVDLSSRGDIRTTADGRYSVFDIISVVAGKGSERKVWKRLQMAHPDLWHFVTGEIFGRSSGYLETPVADLATIIEIIWLVPGDFSAKFRKLGADVTRQF